MTSPKSSRVTAAALVIVALLAISGSSWARPRPVPPAQGSTAVGEADFKAVYERARAHAKAERWMDALLDYRHAFKLAGGQVNAKAAVFHGRAALETNNFAESARMYRYGLQRLSPSDPEHDRVKPLIEARLAQAEAQTGKVEVVTTPAGAIISIDGNAQGTAPFDAPVYITPGSHNFSAQLAGHTPDSVSVRVNPGTLTKVTIQLQPAAAVLPAPGGGFGDSTTPAPEGADAMSPGMLGGGVTMVGLGVVGVVAAIVLGVTANDRANAADALAVEANELLPYANPCGDGSPIDTSDTCIMLEDNHRAALQFRGGAIGAGVVGGVLLAAGVATLVVGAGDKESAPVLSFSASPSSASLSLSGTC